MRNWGSWKTSLRILWRVRLSSISSSPPPPLFNYSMIGFGRIHFVLSSLSVCVHLRIRARFHCKFCYLCFFFFLRNDRVYFNLRIMCKPCIFIGMEDLTFKSVWKKCLLLVIFIQCKILLLLWEKFWFLHLIFVGIFNLFFFFFNKKYY